MAETITKLPAKLKAGRTYIIKFTAGEPEPIKRWHFIYRVRDNRVTVIATADAIARQQKALIVLVRYSKNFAVYILGRRIWHK